MGNLTNYRLAYSRALSDQFIDHLKSKGKNPDAYARQFIEDIFRYALVTRGYRIYEVWDPDSQYHSDAVYDLRHGTIHHCYLRDKGLSYGLVKDSWRREMIETLGVSKEDLIVNITNMFKRNDFYLYAVKKMGIKRRK